MFAGGYTPLGFVDFFDYIMPLETAQKRYFLKGASGSGKSTFIKKIAKKFEAASVGIDIFHCANDATSLDGIAVKDFGFAIMDATAPHSHDPVIPAAIDEIIDFANFLDAEKVRKHANEIKNLLDSKKNMYEKARKFLQAAGNICTANREAHEATLIRPRIQDLARMCLSGFVNKSMNIATRRTIHQPALPKLTNAAAREATDRKLFLCAITPAGIVSFAKNTLGNYKVYGICTETGADALLTEIKNLANSCGISTESFFSPLEPNKRECVILPAEKLAFASTKGIFAYTGKVVEEVAEQFPTIPKKLLTSKADTLRNNKIIKNLLDAAIASMKNAVAVHSKIENMYIDKMDFAKVDDLTEKILQDCTLAFGV